MVAAAGTTVGPPYVVVALGVVCTPAPSLRDPVQWVFLLLGFGRGPCVLLAEVSVVWLWHTPPAPYHRGLCICPFCEVCLFGGACGAQLQACPLAQLILLSRPWFVSF